VTRGVTAVGTGPFHGKTCAEFVKSPDRTYESLMIYCAPQTVRPRTYTFSVYLKGSADGGQAWLRGILMNEGSVPHGENKSVELTTEWKRYSITGELPAQPNESRCFFELRLYSGETMWADAMQLELGRQATEFTLD
jgi:hypothetical protein